jgi:hypothetical protein
VVFGYIFLAQGPYEILGHLPALGRGVGIKVHNVHFIQYSLFIGNVYIAVGPGVQSATFVLGYQFAGIFAATGILFPAQNP